VDKWISRLYYFLGKYIENPSEVYDVYDSVILAIQPSIDSGDSTLQSIVDTLDFSLIDHEEDVITLGELQLIIAEQHAKLKAWMESNGGYII
jgi:hypothetical protein